MLKKKETIEVVKPQSEKGWIVLDIKNLKNLNRGQVRNSNWLSFNNFDYNKSFDDFDVINTNFKIDTPDATKEQNNRKIMVSHKQYDYSDRNAIEHVFSMNHWENFTQMYEEFLDKCSEQNINVLDRDHIELKNNVHGDYIDFIKSCLNVDIYKYKKHHYHHDNNYDSD